MVLAVKRRLLVDVALPVHCLKELVLRIVCLGVPKGDDLAVDAGRDDPTTFGSFGQRECRRRLLHSANDRVHGSKQASMCCVLLVCGVVVLLLGEGEGGLQGAQFHSNPLLHAEKSPKPLRHGLDLVVPPVPLNVGFAAKKKKKMLLSLSRKRE
jgi:hypothetical protein